MKIRKAILTDVAALVAMNRSVQKMHADAFPARFKRDPADELVARAFADAIQAPSSYWLVAEDEQIVGFLSAEFGDRPESWCALAYKVCDLTGIAVTPAWQRRGVARALIAELRHAAAARGVSNIDLSVWSFNRQAVDAYTKMGFKQIMARMSLEPDM